MKRVFHRTKMKIFCPRLNVNIIRWDAILVIWLGLDVKEMLSWKDKERVMLTILETWVLITSVSRWHWRLAMSFKIFQCHKVHLKHVSTVLKVICFGRYITYVHSAMWISESHTILIVCIGTYNVYGQKKATIVIENLTRINPLIALCERLSGWLHLVLSTKMLLETLQMYSQTIPN